MDFAAIAKIEVAVKESDSIQGGAPDGPSVVPLANLGIHVPSDPGDVVLTGRLPEEAVEELIKHVKAWICMLSPAETKQADSRTKEIVTGAGVSWEDVTFVGPVPAEGQAEAVMDALDRLPRPIVISCASGNRAGAGLLLWTALKRNCTAASAELLAKDMDLKFFTRCTTCGPMREWVASKLPGEQAVILPRELKDPFLHQMFDPVTSTFTYLIGCRSTGEAILLDPVREQKERDLRILDELGFKLRYVLNTHVHADHVTAGGLIRNERPEVQTVISEISGAKGDVKIKHGDVISFGAVQLEVRSTPGHTAGCASYVLRPPDMPAMVFTGDALLIRGCGRTDFQQGDAEQLYDSVHTQILSLPPDTLVYPGHDYKGCNVSTVKEEKLYNPRLSKTKEEFLQIMKDLKLPHPKQIDVAVPANMLCGIQD